jgi:hypothetical protein
MREPGSAVAQGRPSGCSSSRSRKLRFWKFSSRSIRFAAAGSMFPSGPSWPMSCDSPASMPSTARKCRFTVLSATRATRSTVCIPVCRALLSSRFSSRLVPTKMVSSTRPQDRVTAMRRRWTSMRAQSVFA